MQALKVLSGKLGERAQEWRSMIIKAMALIEVTIDFADEDIPADVSEDVISILTNIINDLSFRLTRFARSTPLAHFFTRFLKRMSAESQC